MGVVERIAFLFEGWREHGSGSIAFDYTEMGKMFEQLTGLLSHTHKLNFRRRRKRELCCDYLWPEQEVQLVVHPSWKSVHHQCYVTYRNSLGAGVFQTGEVTCCLYQLGKIFSIPPCPGCVIHRVVAVAQAVVSYLWPRRHEFGLGAVYVRFVVDKVGIRRGFIWLLWFFPVGVIPPLFCAHASFICNWHYMLA
jgi:hypothetical protein